MRFSRLTDRLAGLGSAKWAVHVEARARMQRGEPVIMLSIGEPDFAPSAAVLDAAADAMRRGRNRSSSGQGEPAVLDAIARRYSRTAARPVLPSQCCSARPTIDSLFFHFEI